MKLIDNWRQWPKMYSTWAFGSIATIQTATAFIAADVLAARVLLSDYTWQGLISSATAFLAISGMVGRLIAQNNVDDKPKEQGGGD